ncbi:MAG: glycosyltransferase family 2 protein [Spirulinaceae cyanobacterium]
MHLDVIIPVKDRATLAPCVTTLVQSLSAIQMGGRIWVCDGGSQTQDCQAQLQEIQQWPQVKILPCPQPGFNKGWLLNQGLRAAIAPWVLISDVDILWSAATLGALGDAACQTPQGFYHIQTVQEAEPQTIALQRPRYGYHLSQTPRGPRVEIRAETDVTSARPGYGLLCAQRQLFEQVGGYRHDFQGWGWEDQDLLLRSQLLGYPVKTQGEVIHLSHNDEQRNQFTTAQNPQQSRDRNILRCLAGLAQGRLRGDLHPNPGAAATVSQPIQIDYPPALQETLHHFPDDAVRDVLTSALVPHSARTPKTRSQ